MQTVLQTLLYYLPELLLVASLHFTVLVSPGPNFALVTGNSLTLGRRLATCSGFGIALGSLVHILCALVGLSVLVAESPVLFSIIKFFGAAYLMYLGLKALWKSFYVKPKVQASIDAIIVSQTQVTTLEAVRMGFLTQVQNPKAILFFLGLFTQVVGVNTPVWVKALYGGEMILATVIWFWFVAAVFSHPVIRTKVQLFMRYIDRAFGVILIVLGFLLAFTTQHK